jgi:adenylate kinase
MKNAIIITGTPCTGKTTIANKLSLLFKKEVINLSVYAKNKHLLEKYDKKSDTYDVCEKKLIKKLKEDIKKEEDIIFVDGHMSHFLPKAYVKLCIVCKCELKELKKRLKKRKYSKSKIEENLQCEIFDICLNEAIEKKHNIQIFDCTNLNNKNFKKIVSFVEKYIKGHVL